MKAVHKMVTTEANHNVDGGASKKNIPLNDIKSDNNHTDVSFQG